MLSLSNLKLLFKTFVPLFVHCLDLLHKSVYLKCTSLCTKSNCDSKYMLYIKEPKLQYQHIAN